MLLKARYANRADGMAGLDAVVIGRSNIVGKPMAQLLLRESCTVTMAHSRTRDLPEVVRRADIVVAAVGRPEMVKRDWIKPGATVIDVGINRLPPTDATPKGKLVGDVDFAGVRETREVALPLFVGGSGANHRILPPEAPLFIVEEEESLVFAHRAADCTAKLVVAKWRLDRGEGIAARFCHGPFVR